jgi:competence protein ComEA
MLQPPADFFEKHRKPLLIVLLGLILIGLGAFFFRTRGNLSGAKVEVLNSTTEAQETNAEIIVEAAGEVENPGVYKLAFGSRVEDLLIVAGGLSAIADRNWVERNLNRAAKLFDGQKVYIPKVNESDGAPLRQGFAGQGGVVASGQININTADLKTLDTLPGIGPVYGQNIIEHRPYSTVEELLSKGVLKKSVYEKIKDKITVY